MNSDEREQLQRRIDELEARISDQADLLNSAEIAALSLDQKLRVRWLTRGMRMLVTAPALQIGQSIRESPFTFKDADFLKDAELVLRDQQPRQAEVQSNDERCYMRRMMPCRRDDGQLVGIVITFTDTTERRASERRQDILLAELQHRVKNILASVQAIGRMTHQRSTTLAEFWEAFQGRLMALAVTQELLTRAKIEKVGLAELVDRELAAQGARPENIRVEGPELNLTAKAAQNLALALHELTTNATKHGALSVPQGTVEVRWQVQDGQVRFQWIESGGPPVTKPTRRGFGTELMEKAIPYQLRGETVLDYPREGLRCTFDFGTIGNIVDS